MFHLIKIKIQTEAQLQTSGQPQPTSNTQTSGQTVAKLAHKSPVSAIKNNNKPYNNNNMDVDMDNSTDMDMDMDNPFQLNISPDKPFAGHNTHNNSQSNANKRYSIDDLNFQMEEDNMDIQLDMDNMKNWKNDKTVSLIYF